MLTQAKKRPREEAVPSSVFVDLSFEADTCSDAHDVIRDPIINNSNGNGNVDVMERVRNKFKWSLHSEWNDLEDAINFLENEGYVHYDDSNLKIGQKFYFRCKKTPKTIKPYCASRYTLFLPSHKNVVLLLHNANDHNHNEIMKDRKRMMSDEMITYVNQLFEKNVIRYNQIIEFIEEERTNHKIFLDDPNPDVRQIEYRLKNYRNADIKPMINLGDLMEWCSANAAYPANDNEAFVLSYESSSISEALHFRFSMTTPLLLKKCIGLKTLCIDATYKLNWNGFPLIVLGTVDRQKKFHPLVYACTSHETTEDYSFVFESLKNAIEVCFETSFDPTTLIADGAMAIRNAFYNVFASAALDVMCFAHVIRNIRKRPFAMKNNKQLILDDIRKMQSSPSRAIFEKMAELFCEKWEPLEPNFIDYFRSQWLGPLVNWFEGAAEYTPSTNNALESHNATIKRKVTMRRRLPLNQFLLAMKELTECISLQFSREQRNFATEPIMKKPMINAAAIMYQNRFKCFKAKSSTAGIQVFLVPSQHCEEANANEGYYRSLVQRQWQSFDEFMTYGFQKFYIVNMSSASWNSESTCSCVCFFKENICKHIIAIAMREAIIECPDSANPTSLSQYKRKAGPTQKAKKALVFQ